MRGKDPYGECNNRTKNDVLQCNGIFRTGWEKREDSRSNWIGCLLAFIIRTSIAGALHNNLGNSTRRHAEHANNGSIQNYEKREIDLPIVTLDSAAISDNKTQKKNAILFDEQQDTLNLS